MKKNRAKMIMGIFLVFLMIFSIAGIIGGSLSNGNIAPQTFDYNGHEFRYSSQGYLLQYDGQEIPFAFLPNSLLNMSSVPVPLTGEKVYLSVDPTLDVPFDQAQQRIQAFAKFVGVQALPACTVEEGCVDDVPIVECSAEALTLQFRKGPVGIITDDQRCFVLTAETDSEFYQLAEYISYSTLGVI